MHTFFEISPYFPKLLWTCRIALFLLLCLPIIFSIVRKQYDSASLFLNSILCILCELYMDNIIDVSPRVDFGIMLAIILSIVTLFIVSIAYFSNNEKYISCFEVVAILFVSILNMISFAILLYSVATISQVYHKVYDDNHMYINRNSDAGVVENLIGQSILKIYDSKDKIPENEISSHDIAHVQDDGSIAFDINQISIIGIAKIHPVGRKDDIRKMILDYAFVDNTDGINPDIRMICELYYVDDKLVIRKAKIVINYRRFMEILNSDFATIKTEGNLILSEEKRKALQKEISDSEK